MSQGKQHVTKTKRIELRLTGGEYQQIKKQADMVGLTVSAYIRQSTQRVTMIALTAEEKETLRELRRNIALTGNLLKQRNLAYYQLLNRLSELNPAVAKSTVISVHQRGKEVLRKQMENMTVLKNLVIDLLQRCDGGGG